MPLVAYCDLRRSSRVRVDTDTVVPLLSPTIQTIPIAQCTRGFRPETPPPCAEAAAYAIAWKAKGDAVVRERFSKLKTFADLGLSKQLLSTLAQEGYETPTPIQIKAIPLLLEGKDLLGIAQTGTGKTAAFALPILQRLAADRKVAARRTCRVLVLSPTRELATQIAESFKTYGKSLGFTVAVVFGGVKYGPQIKAIGGGLDVLVATPGRLLDHLGERVLDLSATEYFVLDEADQMLDLGFVKPIRQVASRLPKQRQNLFFSATMPSEIGKLAGELLNNPSRVEVAPESTTVERVDQSVVFVEQTKKRALLSELFADPSWSRTLIFTRTKRGADRVAAYLEAGGVEAAAIHGDKSQGQRERALAAFKAGKVRALVATDIAARGIDVDGVTHVVNYELPYVPEAYVHRIGRTARAGASGIAVTLCADDERNLLKDIQRVTRQTIPAFDRRKDRELAKLDHAIMLANPGEKATTPERIKEGGGRGRGGGGEGRGKPRGGGGGGHHGRPSAYGAPRASNYDPLKAGDVPTEEAKRNRPKRRRRPGAAAS
jgi:ATP-dependent RNA helicase RhlE